jgi:hypothetical protein
LIHEDTMTELNLLKVPSAKEAAYEAYLAMFTSLTKREATLDQKQELRDLLHLPPLEE